MNETRKNMIKEIIKKSRDQRKKERKEKTRKPPQKDRKERKQRWRWAEREGESKKELQPVRALCQKSRQPKEEIMASQRNKTHKVPLCDSATKKSNDKQTQTMHLLVH